MNSLLNSCQKFFFLHEGGEACIYLAKNELHKSYIFKWYKDEIKFNYSDIEKLKSINNNGVYHIVESGILKNRSYILYDYIDGVSLDKITPIDSSLGIFLCREILSTLKFLKQEGLFHGDISPSNVIIDINGFPHLVDLGINGPGSPYFSAIEKFQGSPPSETNEIFSIGLLFYFLLTKDSLLRGKNLEEIQDSVKSLDVKKINENLYSKILSKEIRLSIENLSILNPIWKATLSLKKEDRALDYEELDEIFEIAYISLGGENFVYSKNKKLFCKKIQEIKKNDFFELKAVDIPLIKAKEKKFKKIKSVMMVGIIIVIFIVSLSLIFMESTKPVVDETGEMMMKKTKSLKYDFVEDSMETDLKDVLNRMKEEEP